LDFAVNNIGFIGFLFHKMLSFLRTGLLSLVLGIAGRGYNPILSVAIFKEKVGSFHFLLVRKLVRLTSFYFYDIGNA
jgi:hypothetical protein